jgi:glycosyltransferase involved in cell wall biosynthesis
MSAVSVIIPLYKSEPYLEATVASVLAQTVSDFELILVDDCSPDGTFELAKKLAHQDKRITVLQHSSNQGAPAFGRNTALRHAKGTYVTFLDHDDTFEPTKLEKCVQAMQKENVDFVCTNIYLLNDLTGTIDGTAWGKVDGEVQPGFAKRLLKGNFVPPNSTLIKRSVFDTVGVFDTNLRGADDYDMWYRITRIFPASIINEPLATWRYHNAESISANDTFMIEDELHFYEKITEQEFAFAGTAPLARWQPWEKQLAEEGKKRCLLRLGHRHLLNRDSKKAHEHYQAAGSQKLAYMSRYFPQVGRTLYSLKRSRGKQVFRPLELHFS